MVDLVAVLHYALVQTGSFLNVAALGRIELQLPFAEGFAEIALQFRIVGNAVENIVAIRSGDDEICSVFRLRLRWLGTWVNMKHR